MLISMFLSFIAIVTTCPISKLTPAEHLLLLRQISGQNIILNWILLYQIVDGKIKRVHNFSGDIYTSDNFFNHK